MRRASSAGSLVVSAAVSLTIACAGRTLAAGASEPAADRQLEQVVVVFKTHFDIGYTGLASEVVERYRTSMIDKALDVCDSTGELPPEHRFVWTVPGWPMDQILWPGQTAERRKRIEEAIRAGRLVWHALPVTTHTESLDLEDLVRGMRFSSDLSRKFGAPLVRDAKMTDVPSHTWIVPTVLKHAGVDFLHLGCNSASGSPDVPLLFWWEGPDGSRVLTMYEASGYGSGLKPPADWPHKTWLALIHTGDNQGPPPPDQVQKLLDQAARELPGVKVRMGRLSDFRDAIIEEDPDLPVVRDDMPDTWIHGLMSMPRETAMARNVRPRTGAVEALNTLLPVWGVDVPAVTEEVARAYAGTLMFGEHTWGYSMSPFGYHYGDEWRKLRDEGHYARLEKSWVEKGDFARTAHRSVVTATRRSMEALAAAVEVDGPRIVVFNPLPWTRDDVVDLAFPSGNLAGLKEATTGETVPFSLQPADDAGRPKHSRLRFVARDLPPMGYRTYVPAAHSATPVGPTGERATIENRYFRIRVDPERGVIASLVDKRCGRELVDASSKYGFGRYLYERFDTDDIKAYFDAYLKYVPGWAPHFARAGMPPAAEAPHSIVSPEDFELTISPNDLFATARMATRSTDAFPHQVELSVTLFRSQPYVDLEWRIVDKKPDQWPEAGWLCLPLRVDEPAFRLGRLGSVIDPAVDARAGSNFDVFCLNTGMTIAGADGGGAGLCPVDSPLVSIGRPGLYRHTGRFDSRDPVVFVNLFNNVWGTNFQQWTAGTWSSRIRIWSVEGKGVEADLVTPGWQARSPAIAACFNGRPGALPPSGSGIELSRKGVLVTAFGPNPDRRGILLRLWEQAGRDEPCRVRLPKEMNVARVQPSDLRGRPQGDPIALDDGSIDVPLARYAPLSLILSP